MNQNLDQSKPIKRQIYFASSSKAKLNQLYQIMESDNSVLLNQISKEKIKYNSSLYCTDIEWIHVSVDIDEIQSMSNTIVANDKIHKVYEYVKNKYLIENFELVCEDTGYSYANMNGFPGALIRYYHDSIGNQGICKFHGNMRAANISVVMYTNGTNTIQFTGKTFGIVPDKPRPVLGQYKYISSELDTVFIPDYPDELVEWEGFAYSEIPANIKNIVSARGQALSHLKDYLITESKQKLITKIKNYLIVKLNNNYITN